MLTTVTIYKNSQTIHVHHIMTDNPDYEGPRGASLRQEAEDFANERSRLFDAATAKRESGDHKTANALVEQAKEMGERMKEKNREAAAAILQYNNADKGFGEDYLDLHGLREEEAMDYLHARVELLERTHVQGSTVDFTVIPGAGHHSGPAGQKLKTATERYLKSKRIPFELVNEGQLLAKVSGTAAAADVPAASPGAAAPAPAAANPSPAAPAAAEAPAKSSGSCCIVM